MTSPTERRVAVELVVPTLDIGGMEIMVASMARGLAARGHRVGVTCLEHAGVLAADLERDGVRVSVVSTPGLTTLVHAPALAAHFAALSLDVVHSHNGVWEKASRAARRAGVPRVVNTLHGLHDREYWYVPMLMRWAARHTDVVVPVSEPLDRYLHDVVRLPAGRTRVLLNGIDTTRFHGGAPTHALRAALGLGDDTPLVGTVARLATVKNHTLLVDAFARVVERVPAAHLVIVGDGPLRGVLEAQIDALGLRDRVHLPGMMTDLATVYRDLDVFVLSSLAEGTSMSMLEAMASERACVATTVGGNAHLLDDGTCGRLVPSGDVEAMAGAVAELLAAPGRRSALGVAARARVVARFSESAMLDAYEALYVGDAPRTLPLPEEALACAG